MSADRKPILSPFGGRKKRMSPNKRQRTVMTKENRQNLADTDRNSMYRKLYFIFFMKILLLVHRPTPICFQNTKKSINSLVNRFFSM